MPANRKPVKRLGPSRVRRYGRVSTLSQDDEGTISIPDQDKISLDYVNRSRTVPWLDLGFTYDTESGTSTDRKHWQELIAECRRGEVDVIVCAKLDRFARSALAGLQQIAELNELGVEVVVCDIDLDTSTPPGKAMRAMLLVFAELERDTIVDRMSKGQYGKARNGGWPSSKSAAPYGMTVEGIKRESRLVLEPSEQATVSKAAELIVDEGYGVTDACRVLNALGMLPRKGMPWYPALLRDVLVKPALKGEVYWGKTGNGYGPKTRVAAPQVLTPERWDAVQRALNLRSSEGFVARRTYPLTGRMFGPCGRAFQGVFRSDSGKAQYRDAGKIWRDVPGGFKPCACARLDAPTIEGRVWAEVSALLSDPDRLQALASNYLGATGDTASQEAELGKIDREATALQQRMTNAMATWIRTGSDQSIFDAAMEQLRDELDALIKRRDDIARYLAESEQSREQMTSLGGLAARVSGRLGSMTLDEQKEVLDLLKVRVEVLDNTKAPAIRITGTITDFALGCDPGPGAPLSRCSPCWSQVED